jgi:hypothetical protein
MKLMGRKYVTIVTLLCLSRAWVSERGICLLRHIFNKPVWMRQQMVTSEVTYTYLYGKQSRFTYKGHPYNVSERYGHEHRIDRQVFHLRGNLHTLPVDDRSDVCNHLVFLHNAGDDKFSYLTIFILRFGTFYLPCCFAVHYRRDSSVTISTGYRVRYPAVEEFTLLHSVQTESGAHPTSYPVGAGVTRQRREPCHAPPSAEVKKSGAVPPPPIYISLAKCLIN